jgi:hypothetical protein
LKPFVTGATGLLRGNLVRQVPARGDRISSLRRKQLQVAMSGSVPMLIWLGKQLLGQTDRQETRITLTPAEVSHLSDDQLARVLAGEPL